jgi:hypothetical protein
MIVQIDVVTAGQDRSGHSCLIRLNVSPWLVFRHPPVASFLGPTGQKQTVDRDGFWKTVGVFANVTDVVRSIPLRSF